MAPGSINPIPAGNVSYTSGAATDRGEEVAENVPNTQPAKDVFMSVRGGHTTSFRVTFTIFSFRVLFFFSGNGQVVKKLVSRGVSTRDYFLHELLFPNFTFHIGCLSMHFPKLNDVFQIGRAHV